MNLLDQGINFLQQTVDIFSKRLAVFNVLHLLTEEVNGLEEQFEQGRALLLRDNFDGFVPDDGEQVLHPVGNGHDGIILHHGGGALDGVHNPEDGIDVLLGKGILLLGGQNDAVQLFQKGVGLIKVGV